jgi:hypothetical protein
MSNHLVNQALLRPIEPGPEQVGTGEGRRFGLDDDIKAKIDKRADQRDAKAAAKDADRAERDAIDAIDYAVFAFYSAQLAVLDALDARAYADERAKIAGS